MAESSLDTHMTNLIAAQAGVTAELKSVNESLGLIRTDMNRLHDRIDRANDRTKNVDDKHIRLAEEKEAKVEARIGEHVAQDHRKFDEFDGRLISLEKRATGEDAVRKNSHRRERIEIALASIGLTGLATWLATHIWPFSK